MKHNWEYKKLGDICQTISGLWTGKNPPFVNVGVIRNTNFTKQCTLNPDNIFYTDVEVKAFAKRKLQKGDIIIEKSGGSEKQPVGRPILFLLDGEFSFSNFTATLRLKDKSISSIFLHKSLTSLYFNGVTRKLQSRTTGLFNLNWKEYLNLRIPVPPMEVQERIVAELDKINDVIEDCRELLRNLDALAQSLFYDFFGDPITNPKGWPLYKLSSISQLINGRAYKQNELLDEGKYKVIRVGNFFTNSDYYYSDLELSPEKYIDYGDLIFAWSASFGAFIWQGDKVIYHYHIWKILFDDNLLNKIFYKFLLNEMTSSFMKDLHGIGMMHLTKAGMENYMLPVPPLSLQEQFAARIEQIEAQKKAVEQTIAELQTLLDSRMDYWFN